MRLWSDGTTHIRLTVLGSQIQILTPNRFSFFAFPHYFFKSFEQLNEKCIAVVIDPIQSVKGQIVIDAFRLISKELKIHKAQSGTEPR